jgi:hypothetical protein
VQRQSLDVGTSSHWHTFLFGPFYAVAVYAIVKGKEWIRGPASSGRE